MSVLGLNASAAWPIEPKLPIRVFPRETPAHVHRAASSELLGPLANGQSPNQPDRDDGCWQPNSRSVTR
jgi:hypothetical protein